MVLLCAANLSAQDVANAPARTWRLAGLRRGFCIHLLLDPADPPAKAEGVRLLPATEVSDLHPALRGVIQEQPEFVSWIPSSLCLYALDTVETASFRVVNKKGRDPILVGLWTAAATEGVSDHRRDFVIELLTSHSRLRNQTQTTGPGFLPADVEAGLAVEKDKDGVATEYDRFRLKVEKTTLTWDGPPGGDSTPVTERTAAEWVTRRGRGLKGLLPGTLSFSPAWSHGMAGILRIQGKDAFAKSLTASPIRFVGPAWWGGEGELRLGR